VGGAVTPSTRLYVMDARAASGADLRLAASRFHVYAVGPIWLCDRAEGAAPLDGYALDEREPSFWSRWSRGPTEPLRSIRFSAWATWEWRALIGQVAPPPTDPPATDDELRIAHNLALERGDAGGAARWRSALEARFNLKLAAQYEGGTALIGGRENSGAQRSVRLYFVAGAMPGDDRFGVHAKVIAPPRWSTLPADPLDLETAGGPDCPTTLWRPGHLYGAGVVIRKRPGREIWLGAWTPGPRRTDAPGPLPVLRL
jgi:hypothetical protein